MYSVPADLRYTSEHEWARREENGRVRVGITDYAQQNLGDITYLQLPEPGTAVVAGEAMAEIESPKVASDIYSPVTGRCAEANKSVEADPEIVNQDPYGRGWMVIIEDLDIESFDRLLSPSDYRALIEET